MISYLSSDTFVCYILCYQFSHTQISLMIKQLIILLITSKIPEGKTYNEIGKTT